MGDALYVLRFRWRESMKCYIEINIAPKFSLEFILRTLDSDAFMI